MAEDVADRPVSASCGSRSATTRSALVDRLGEWLFDEHVRAGLHRLDRVIRVGVGQRVDRHHVRRELGERLLVIRITLRAGECVRQRFVGDTARADAGDLKLRNPRVGERV